MHERARHAEPEPRGQPGEAGTIAVYGSAQDPCVASGNYVSGP
jgi:hypothetical protein